MRNDSLLSPSMDSSDPAENEECPYMHGFVWRQEYLTDVTYRHIVALTIINLLAVLLNLVLNTLVIIAVATRHRLQSKSNVLVAWLAGADLLNGLVTQDIEIAINLTRIFSDGPFCNLEKASVVAMTACCFLSLGSLVLISINRYFSIKDPLRYTTIVTSKRIKTGLLLTWATGLFVTIHELTLAVIDSETDLYFLYMKVSTFILSILVLLALLVISYAYGYIFSESQRHKKRLHTEQLPAEEAKRLKKENKAANTLTLILATLVITYIPTVVLVFITGYSEDILELHITSVIWSWVTTFSLVGSLCNPIIFFWRMKNLRDAILEILHYRQPENSPPPIEMREIKRNPFEVQPSSTTEAFSSTGANEEPVLPLFKNLQALETACNVEETAV